MIKLTNYILVLFTALTVFTSCNKDKVPKTNPDISNDPNQGDINSFFSSHAATPQAFTVSTSSAVSIVGAKGTTINIPALAFKTSGGTQILGQVIIKLTELYSKRDLILNKVQTTTKDDILQTKGIVKLNVTQGEETLMLDAAKTVTINYPATVTPGNDMFAFFGKNDLVSTNLIWLPDTVGGPNYAGPVINPVMSYSLVSDSLNWINCGKFNIGAGIKSTFTITVHGNYNRSNTEIFVYFPTHKSIAYLYKGEAQAYPSLYRVASGTACSVIAISKINGKFYSSKTDVTMSVGLIKDLDLTETTESAILTMLDNL